MSPWVSTDGGRGDDQLDGQEGSDTYVFTRLDGRDILDDTGGASDLDVLEIRGYTPDDVIVTRPNPERNDLLLSFENTQDEILLRGQFSVTAGQGIEQIEFGDGTVWDRTTLTANITAGGTYADDTITGQVRLN